MYNVINVSCAEIERAVGFLYMIQSVILNQTLNVDCEQSWYSEDGRLIADPSKPHKLINPAKSVSSDRLVTSHCVNMNHEIICDSADGFHFSRVTAFRARNQTAVTPNPDDLNEVIFQHSDRSLWILAVFVIAILIIILICFLWQKNKLRCFPNVFRCNDSENRDAESDVQMQLGADESDSLNQSVLRSSE